MSARSGREAGLASALCTRSSQSRPGLRGLRGPLLSAVVAAVEMRENRDVAGAGVGTWLWMLVPGCG